MPVAIDWAAGRTGAASIPARAAELFAEFGFHSLTEKMRAASLNRRPARRMLSFRGLR